jgi:O-antigen ligase
VNWPVSLKVFSEIVLEWYVPLFVCILVVRTHKDIILLLKVLAICTIAISFAGLIEFLSEHKYYFDLIPKSMLDSMLKNNPSFAFMYNNPVYRDGSYRANSIFYVSLSLGEFVAIMSPIAAYFILDGRNRRERLLGIVTGVWCLIGLYCSGSRGGYVGFLTGIPIFAFVWTVRHSKLNPSSLVSGLMRFVFTAGTIATFLLILFWPRLHAMVLGYDDGDRILQWQMALPHIIESPVTGHGLGTAGAVVGYGNFGLFSVDSYIISTLVELGVPGFLLFFCMILIPIWNGLRLYLTDMDEEAAIAGSLACSLLAFAVYRITLSQQENHTLVFLIVGLMFVIGKLAKDRRAAMMLRQGVPSGAGLRVMVPAHLRQ